MTIRDSPYVAYAAGVLLCTLALGAAPPARDYQFRHENVLGTSLELCVRADNEEAARSAEGPYTGRDRPTRRRFQRLRSLERIDALTWPSGLRTRAGSRHGRWSSGSRSVSQARAGTATSSVGFAMTRSAGNPTTPT